MVSSVGKYQVLKTQKIDDHGSPFDGCYLIAAIVENESGGYTPLVGIPRTGASARRRSTAALVLLGEYHLGAKNITHEIKSYNDRYEASQAAAKMYDDYISVTVARVVN